MTEQQSGAFRVRERQTHRFGKQRRGSDEEKKD